MRLRVVISIDQKHGEHFILQIYAHANMDTHTLAAHAHIYDSAHTEAWEVANPKRRGLVGRGGASLFVRSKGLAHTHTHIYMYIYLYMYIFDHMPRPRI